MKLVRVVECRRISPSIRVSAIPFSLPVPNSVGGVIAVEADDQVFCLLFVCCYYYCHREIREMLLPPICRIWTIFISCHLASRMTADRLFRRYADWRVLCPDLENAGDIGQIKCAAECSQRSNCSGFNHFDLTSDWIVCELCYAEYPENITLISPDTKSTAYALADLDLGLYTCEFHSPCSDTSDQYYPHEDPAQYIQCGGALCYPRECADGTKWHQELLRCE
ncbi:hypothetical protein LSH36_512g01012 [Paralvinella palmiformis]|uniref:Chitin-binding type-2 domain-containing protein n=1 Tax=Paralvinella palmiformis TaxID=53620 RepID=A0AAD9MXT4_9ANNE|nr:hypothetical protein LSH36_512g01012 [Paralvinella palmiformis]